jgi:serine/threonine protein kinase
MFICPECAQTHPARGACPKDGTALLDASGDPLLGQLVGSYRVACQIGAGGMGQVYRGVHPAIGSRVAIKVLVGDWSRESSLVERFFSEARAVNLIRHENIVNVLDLAWLPDGRPYIVMEYLDGHPLSAHIHQLGRLPLGSLVTLMVEVATALAAAHAKGVIHRDLKPDNIFVTPGGHAKVLDFGVAKLRLDDVSSLHAATATGSILGTPHYMSPEQALGRRVDHRSDLYSLGVVLYEGTTGRRPFVGDTLFDVLKQHIETMPPLPESLRAEVPSALSQVILRALEKNPEHRHADARALVSALGEAAQWLPRDSFTSLGATTLAAPRLAPATGSSGFAASAVASAVPSAVVSGAGSLASSAASLYTSPCYATATAAQARRKPWVLVAAVAGGLAALGGIALLLGAFYYVYVLPWTRALSATPIAPVSPQLEQPSGFNRNRVVVWEQFELAEKRARQTFPDAGLLQFLVYGVNRQGIVNLDIRGKNGTMVLFRWRSPAMSQRPADLPQGAEVTARCIYQYVVTEYGVMALTPDRQPCQEPILSRPRCTLEQLWSKAEARGAPRGNYIGDFAYLPDSGKPAHWYVTIDKFSEFLPDDC